MLTSMILSLGMALPAADGSAVEPVVLHDRGAWCWFQDERAIFDGGRLVAGVVAAGSKGDARAGSVELIVYDSLQREPNLVELHRGLEQDDHCAPALLVRGDGRYLAVYARHGTDKLIRYRISVEPHNPAAWRPEQTLPRPARVTYSNLFRLAQENGGKGRIYDFYRGEGWNPNFMVSDDDGETWSYGGRLLVHPGRPYVKYASNNRDQIHFVFGEAHPAEYPHGTGIYHAYYQNGNLYRSDGTPIGKLSSAGIAPRQATTVFAGDAKNIAWICDIRLDDKDRPCMAYSVLRNGDFNDHRYRYARWDGTRWQDHEIAFAGTRLYAGEEHYTGLAALNPRNPHELFISTNADPLNGRPLVSNADHRRHWEIFRGLSGDGGATWAWTPVTANSTADNLRPIMPDGDCRVSMLLWLRGTYTSYRDWKLQVVGCRSP